MEFFKLVRLPPKLGVVQRFKLEDFEILGKADTALVTRYGLYRGFSTGGRSSPL
jgi:hypothetical protein